MSTAMKEALRGEDPGDLVDEVREEVERVARDDEIEGRASMPWMISAGAQMTRPVFLPVTV